MSSGHERWIDAALGEASDAPLASAERELLESYERTAARAHLALALDAPLAPPSDLRARLLRQGLRVVSDRTPTEGAE